MPLAGQVCEAVHADDGLWYPARVAGTTRKAKRVFVSLQFLGYGNEAQVPVWMTRPLSEETKRVWASWLDVSAAAPAASDAQQSERAGAEGVSQVEAALDAPAPVAATAAVQAAQALEGVAAGHATAAAVTSVAEPANGLRDSAAAAAASPALIVAPVPINEADDAAPAPRTGEPSPRPARRRKKQARRKRQRVLAERKHYWRKVSRPLMAGEEAALLQVSLCAPCSMVRAGCDGRRGVRRRRCLCPSTCASTGISGSGTFPCLTAALRWTRRGAWRPPLRWSVALLCSSTPCRTAAACPVGIPSRQRPLRAMLRNAAGAT